MHQYFDIGVNLGDKRLADAQVIEDAKKAGVSLLAATGTTVEESRQNLRLAEAYPDNVVATVGIHPHYAKDAGPDYLKELKVLASHPQARAIGECGLDFNRNFSPPETQLQVFEGQLALAAELSMPVFLHERDAFEQQIGLISKYRDKLSAGVAHCFTGDLSQMKGYLDLGLYIGITGWVCDPKRGESLREAVRQLPPDRIMLETDAPYLFPKTLRPRRSTNVPANLPHIASEVAQLMNISVESLAEHAFSNSTRFFGISQG